MTFDRFVIGQVIGAATDCVDDDLLTSWRRLYPWDAAVSDEVPVPMICALTMRAYLKVVMPRPEGNIHASQTLKFLALPKAGEPIRTVVSCSGKELKRERRFVDFVTRSTGRDGRKLFDAGLRLVWAA